MVEIPAKGARDWTMFILSPSIQFYCQNEPRRGVSVEVLEVADGRLAVNKDAARLFLCARRATADFSPTNTLPPRGAGCFQASSVRVLIGKTYSTV